MAAALSPQSPRGKQRLLRFPGGEDEAGGKISGADIPPRDQALGCALGRGTKRGGAWHEG